MVQWSDGVRIESVANPRTHHPKAKSRRRIVKPPMKMETGAGHEIQLFNPATEGGGNASLPSFGGWHLFPSKHAAQPLVQRRKESRLRRAHKPIAPATSNVTEPGSGTGANDTAV